MASLFPFRALIPAPGVAGRVSSVPYDVVDRSEAARIGVESDASFIHVVRPEIDLAPSVDVYDASVYREGRRNFDRLKRDELLIRDEAPGLYAYRMTTTNHTQTGIVACCSVSEYRSGTIRLHEQTRPTKEDDRVAHMLSLDAHPGPVLTFFRRDRSVEDLLQKNVGETIFEFTAQDGVRHEGWRIEAPDPVVSAFSSITPLYIADGHHRAAAAARVAAERSSDADAQVFLCVLFPDTDMRILPYNRYFNIDGEVRSSVVTAIASELTEIEESTPAPPRPGIFSLYDGSAWRSFELPSRRSDDPAERLDIAVFNQSILSPIVGIRDQRTDPRIDFVGGDDSIKRLERRVDSEGGLGATFFPVSVDELIAVADSNSIMPPKSTWFAPKLRSGLFVHEFG